MDITSWTQDMEHWVEQVAAYQRDAAQRQSLDIRTKGQDTDYVTDVDIQSEAMLISFIQKRYPDHSIYSEEKGRLEQGSDYLWVIDPIDGTTNFIHGFPMSSISIALQYQGSTVVGMVCAPALNMTFYAARGRGAYLNGKRIHVSGRSDLTSSLLATGFPNDRTRSKLNLPYFSRMSSLVSGIRRTGSAALDLCFVAAACLDGFWEFDLNSWDMCAGALMIEEAGGEILQLEVGGHNLLLCSNSQLLESLRTALLSEDDI
ncbi:inositol monophosphatase family protein [Paenibacillus paeoniae]|uniref:Inositol-1-monophosphatase n=1 Tax=Paenibacillus paeoniae TaxID=2292705 RepID=A0A371PH88_9BACL|nr:inositol monophosphatase family protein [Paenibacillus paeoniae]REK75592.1 inositol monophosphatase [Paenibacillus paeoniae]